MALQNNPTLLPVHICSRLKGIPVSIASPYCLLMTVKKQVFFYKNTRLYEWQMLRVAKLIF
jgi:hypothetical protein